MKKMHKVLALCIAMILLPVFAIEYGTVRDIDGLVFAGVIMFCIGFFVSIAIIGITIVEEGR